jgi:hypothetical protein
MKVVGVCSDNASPFETIRIACGNHTCNLIPNNFAMEFPLFNNLRTQLAAISHFLRKKSNLEEVRVKKSSPNLPKCPLFQPQRWNTEFFILDYIVKHFEEYSTQLTKEFPFLASHFADILDFHAVLKPLADFSISIEENMCTQGELFLKLTKLKMAYQNLANPYAENFLNYIESRFHSTADETFSELCYRFTLEGIIQFREEYPLPEETEIFTSKKIRTLGLKFEDKFIDLYLKFEWFAQRFEMKLSESMQNTFRSMLVVFSEKNISIIFNNFHIPKIPGIPDDDLYILKRCHRMLSTLPSSEAFCERVFSHFRNLLPKNRFSTKENNLRNMLLIRIQILSTKHSEHYNRPLPSIVLENQIEEESEEEDEIHLESDWSYSSSISELEVDRKGIRRSKSKEEIGEVYEYEESLSE